MILISLFIYHSTSLMMIGLILLIVWFVKIKISDLKTNQLLNRKDIKAEKELKDQPDIQQHQHNIQRHQHTLTDIHHTVAASKAQQRIPKAYTHIHSLRSMFSYLYNQRADTLKEAINLYETESHQARMEGQQQQILSTVTQTSVDAKAAKYASELAASIPKHLQYGQKERHIALEQPMKMPQKLLKMQVQQQLMRIKQEKY